MNSSDPHGKDWQERNLANIVRIKKAATTSANDSGLPGHVSGPNDALRHIIGAAELRRQYGPIAALTILESNEVLGTINNNQSPADAAMDRRNNLIGIQLGRGAKSYEEVVERAKAFVAKGIAQNGTGKNGTPIFLPPHLWRTNRGVPDTNPIPQEFLERARRSAQGAGGDVTVTAYTRDDGTRVATHSRSRPGPDDGPSAASQLAASPMAAAPRPLRKVVRGNRPPPRRKGRA